jgi:MOSC domain-containing protein YiiM
MQITSLHRYDDNGVASRHDELRLELDGIVGNRPCTPLRQVLLLPQSALTRHDLAQTTLKQNVLLEGGPNIHDLPSGSILAVGEAHLHLTFHCEPCKHIATAIPPKRLLHQRGYLARIIQPGRIRVDDQLQVLPNRLEPIPYAASDRIRWYLAQLQQPIMASKLVDAVGLPKSYCRALPALLRKHPDLDASLVRFASARRDTSD